MAPFLLPLFPINQPAGITIKDDSMPSMMASSMSIEKRQQHRDPVMTEQHHPMPLTLSSSSSMTPTPTVSSTIAISPSSNSSSSLLIFE